MIIGHSMGAKVGIAASCMFNTRFTQLFILGVEPVNYLLLS